MKAIRLEEPRRFEYVDIADPGPPGPGHVLVRTHRMGICGTDLSGFLGKFPFFKYPRVPGHELGVEVLAVGDGVANVKIGDRCSVEPYMNCGTCFACRRGQGNCCTTLNVIGVMIDGGLCERFLIRADKLHPSAKLSYEQLALVETLAIGCHATDRGASTTGDHVLIIGAGPIGLATLEFTRLTGATVTVMDMVQSRLDFCKQQYGIQHTILFKNDGSELEQMKAITAGDMYLVVTDATGNKYSMSSAMKYVRALVLQPLAHHARLRPHHWTDRRRHHQHHAVDYSPHAIRKDGRGVRIIYSPGNRSYQSRRGCFNGGVMKCEVAATLRCSDIRKTKTRREEESNSEG